MLSWYWQFISWNIEDKRYYVGNMTDITSYKRESEITLNLMKKHNVRGKNLYFIYPLRAYIVVVDDLPVSKCLWTLSHLRRDTTVIYHIKQFNQIPLTHIFWQCDFIFFIFFHYLPHFSPKILFSQGHNYWDNGIITSERNSDANNINFLN